MHRAYRNIEGAPALGAQPWALPWWIEHQPYADAFAKRRSAFFVEPAFCVLKYSAIEGEPVAAGPLSRVLAIASATAWSAVLRARRPAGRIAAYAATPAAVLVTCELLNVRHVWASAS